MEYGDALNGEKGIFVLSKIGELAFKSLWLIKIWIYWCNFRFISNEIVNRVDQSQYQSFLKLIQDFIEQFIWDNMDINELYDGFKWLFKKESSSLHIIIVLEMMNCWAKKNGDRWLKIYLRIWPCDS